MITSLRSWGMPVVAVMAFTTITRGAVAELDLPWDTTAPITPPDQFAVP